MKKKPGIFDKILKYYQLIQAIVVLIVVFTVFSFIDVPKQETPKLIINQGAIIGLYPEANSAKVQKELTTKVESFIFCYNEVDQRKTYSQTKDGIMFIHVELVDSVKYDTLFWKRMEKELANLSLQ